MPRQLFARSELCRLRAIDAEAYTIATAFTSYHYHTNTFNTINLTNPGDMAVGQIPGWAICAAKYAYYRVLAYTVSFTITNEETYGLLFTVLHSNTAITENATNMQLAASSPIFGYSRLLQIPPTPSSTFTYRKRMTIQNVVGSRATRMEHNYTALTTPTDPTDLTHLYFGISSTAGASVNHHYKITFDWEVEFYDPKVQFQ